MSESVNRRISIFIDAVQAEAQLAKLNERQQTLIRTNSELKEGSSAWKANAQEIEKVNKQISLLNDQLSGKVGPTMAQLKKQQAQLTAELDKMPVSLRKGSEEWAKLQKVQTLIAGVKKETQGTAAAWQQFTSQIKAGAVGVLGGNLATAAVSGTFNYVQQAIANAAKVSDQLADVRKTTGLTTEEVTNLNSALGKIDTRTATSELRNMAVVAGQFGIPKDQLLGFVKAVDMVNIALGDEFGGGAEAIATEMSKLRNVFTDIKTDDIGLDIKHISNALNELGAAGVATGPVVADFANRIAGVGIPLGLTTGQVLGLSATLQELNVSTERGGTAVTKILQKMLTNTKDFAAIAGEDIASFEKKLNTDLMGAFVAVMEGSQKTGKSSTILANIIKELELSGAGASEVFSKLGTNTDLLAKRIKLSNDTLIDTNSITNEATIKQDNLAGSIARLEKQWAKLTNSGGAQSFWKMMVDGASASIEGLSNFWNYLAGPTGQLKMAIEDTSEKMLAEVEKQAEARKAQEYKIQQQRKAELQAMTEAELDIERKKNIAKQKLALEASKIEVANGNKAGFADQKKVFNQASDDLKMIDAIIAKKKEQASITHKLTEEEVKEIERKQKKAQDYLDQFRKFQQEVELVSKEAAAAAEGKDEAEIEKVSSKYEKLLIKAKEHYQKLPGIVNEYYQTVQKINEAEYNDKLAIYDKQIAAAQKAFDSETEAFLKAERAKTQAAKDETARRLQAAYKNEISSKSASLLNGETDGNLTDEEKLDKKKEILLLETQAKLDNEKLTTGEIELIWAEHYATMKMLDQDYVMSKIDRFQSFAREALGVFQAVSSYQMSIMQQEMAEQQKNDDIQKKQAQDKLQRDMANLQRKNDNEKLELKKLLTSKAITQEEYDKRMLELDGKTKEATLNLQANYDKVKDAIDNAAYERERNYRRKSAELQKIAAVTEATIQTAVLAFEAAAQGFLNPLADFKFAMASAQLALLIATPIPEYAVGGSTVVTGSNTGKTYNAKNIGSFKNGGKVSSTSYGIIGEQGAELVIPNWLYTHPKMFDTMNFLEYNIARGKEFGNGGSTQTQPAPIYAPMGQSTTDPALLATLQGLMNVVAKLEQQMQKPMVSVISYDQVNDSTNRVKEIEQMSGLG